MLENITPLIRLIMKEGRNWIENRQNEDEAPQKKVSRTKRAARWVDNFTNRWAIQLLSLPLLLLPPAIVVACMGRTASALWMKANWPSVYGVVQGNVGIMLIATVVWSPFWGKIKDGIHLLGKTETVDIDGLTKLLNALDSVVGQKEQRFGGFLETIDPETANGHYTFCEITQPELQIKEITRGIYDLYRLLDTKNSSIRVTLAIINENDKVAGHLAHYPPERPVKSKPSKLNLSRSTVSLAIRSRSIEVVESIKDESKKKLGFRRYVCTDDNRKHEDGSVVCYPVIHHQTDRVVFVISLSCDTPRYFKRDQADMYELTLRRFALRMGMEYSLLGIKDAICDRR